MPSSSNLYSFCNPTLTSIACPVRFYNKVLATHSHTHLHALAGFLQLREVLTNIKRFKQNAKRKEHQENGHKKIRKPVCCFCFCFCFHLLEKFNTHFW